MNRYATLLASVLSLALPVQAQVVLETPSQSFFRRTGENIRQAVEAGQRLSGQKREATQEIREARAAFFEGCGRGVRDDTNEGRLVDLLFWKDYFYLSQYVAYGVTPETTRHLQGVDQLTGSLDGGINVRAQDAFTAWVNAVRRHLGATRPGVVVLPNPSLYLAAIDASQPEYERYRTVRDRTEFERWHQSRMSYLAPPAATPEARADTYLNVIARPAISERLAALPEAGRADTERKADEWLVAARAVIITFESMPLTLEPLLPGLRNTFPQDLVEQFIAAYERAVAAGGNIQTALIDGYIRLVQRNDSRRSGREVPFIGRRSLLELSVRSTAFAVLPNGHLSDAEVAEVRADNPAFSPTSRPTRLDYVFGPDQSRIGLGRSITYSIHRERIIEGGLRPPPWRPDPNVDSCIGTTANAANNLSSSGPVQQSAAPPPGNSGSGGGSVSSPRPIPTLEAP